MAKLSYHQRSLLPSSAFVFPKKRKYPIEDESHARAALSRVSQYGTPKEKSQVRAAVHRKFPGIGKKPHERSLIHGMKSYETGGMVEETGPAYLHEGEEVIPASHDRQKKLQGDIDASYKRAMKYPSGWQHENAMEDVESLSKEVFEEQKRRNRARSPKNSLLQ